MAKTEIPNTKICQLRTRLTGKTEAQAKERERTRITSVRMYSHRKRRKLMT